MSFPVSESGDTDGEEPLLDKSKGWSALHCFETEATSSEVVEKGLLQDRGDMEALLEGWLLRIGPNKGNLGKRPVAEAAIEAADAMLDAISLKK